MIGRKATRLTKEKAKTLVAAGLQRSVAQHGKDEVALAGGCTTRCIEKALALQTLPSFDVLLNLLDKEPTALAESFTAKGFTLIPNQSSPANDLSLAGGLSEAASAIIYALLDHKRSPSETCKLADIFRPLVPGLQAIIAEADRIKGLAA